MDLIIFLFVGAICFPAGMKILSSEERNKVFNRYHIEVEDVKKYNKACGWLVIGFGVVAELTMLCAYAAELTLYLGSIIQGWYSILLTVGLILEAIIVMKIYGIIEKKMLKKD